MNRQSGLGKFEFAIVVIIIGILAHVLLGRLVALEHETERLAVQLTVRHINIGLKLSLGERLMRGEEARIPALLEENPLRFLGDQNVGAGGTAPGSWNFESTGRTLNYLPRQPEAFGGQVRLAWRLTAHVDALGRTVGLRLEPLK